MDTWFTADLHLSHANILQYCKRPFSDVAGMNETLIANWNAKVSKKDLVYLLGDVIFSRIRDQDTLLNRLNGKIILIQGNHDTGLVKRQQGLIKPRFESITQFIEIKDGADRFTLCHYPLRTWAASHYGAYQLHGHSHSNLEAESTRYGMRRLDVGVDVHGFSPLSFDDIRTKLASREWKKNRFESDEQET